MSQTDSWSFTSTPTFHYPTQSGSIKLPFNSHKTETNSANSAPWSTGYFAFPPEGVSARTEAPLPRTGHRSESKGYTTESEPLSHPPQVQSTSPESAVLAAEGEREWVRAGGVLRDARGRIDRKRTEALRTVLEAESAAAINRALWQAYEERWRALLRDYAQGVTEILHWEDVPWPTRETTERWSNSQYEAKLKTDSLSRGPNQGMYIPPSNDTRSGTTNRSHAAPSAGQPPVTVASEIAEDMAAIPSITDEDIESFIYDPISLDLPFPPASTSHQPTEDEKLAICKSKPAHHRIRRELLHWHSDKFDNVVLSRVPEEGDERTRVAEDAGRVWRWLSVQGARARTTDQE